MMLSDQYELDSETIDTPVGEYTVRWLADPHAEEPYDCGLGFAFDGCREYATDCRKDVVQGELADQVLDIIQIYGRNAVATRASAAGMARYLRIKYGLVGILEVDEDYRTSEPSTDLSERVYGLAWAPKDATYPQEYTESQVAAYRAWAEGDCFGWEVLDPQERLVEDCWGYYGLDRERDYTLETAREVALADANERIARANLVGAGFVGLV